MLAQDSVAKRQNFYWQPVKNGHFSPASKWKSLPVKNMAVTFGRDHPSACYSVFGQCRWGVGLAEVVPYCVKSWWKGAEWSGWSFVCGSMGQEQGKLGAGLLVLFGLQWTEGTTWRGERLSLTQEGT